MIDGETLQLLRTCATVRRCRKVFALCDAFGRPERSGELMVSCLGVEEIASVLARQNGGPLPLPRRLYFAAMFPCPN